MTHMASRNDIQVEEGDTASAVHPGKAIFSERDANIIERYGQTHRGLSPRHVQLMAIGGSIGTALFVGIGGVLSKSGPLSLILGYLFWCIFFIWPCNLVVAEMCAYLPIRGSIFELASRFIDPAVGFALGWTYYYMGQMLVCTEYSAVATVIGFWLPDWNPAIWVAISMVVCILVNILAVKWYGETEFVMASLKIILLVGLVMTTLITMSGGNPHHDAYGFRNWGDGQAMLAYYTDGAVGRFCGWWKVCLFACFTVAGPDMIVISCGEMRNPRRTIPRVAKLIFYRLMGFYVIGVLAVGIICSPKDKRLLGAISDGSAGSAASPWVIGIQNLGITGLPSVINFAIMTSGLSCGNAYLYSASRTLYGLARDGQAPQFFLQCTKSGVPLRCVLAVSLISCATFLVSSNAAVEVFYWFVDLTTIGQLITYSTFTMTFVFWYRARAAQGLTNDQLYYVAPFMPYGAYISLTVGFLTMLFIGFDSFKPFSVQGFITSYFCIPYSLILFTFWKVFKKTKFVSPAEADLVTGKADVDAECREWEEGGIEENWNRELEKMPFWRRFFERMW